MALATTPLPSPTGAATLLTPPVLAGFHFFSACGESEPWNSAWYTAPFCTVSSTLRYTVHYVHALTIGGPSGGQPTLWLVSHFGAFICLTPLVYGLALASRRLWSYAAGMLAVALLSLLVIESVTYRIRRRPTRRDLDKDVRAALMSLRRRLAQSTDNAEPAPGGLKEDGGQACALPLPLKTETVDDMINPALAAATYPQAPPHLLEDPADRSRRLCYPSSVLQPGPVLWLEEGRTCLGRREADDLDRYHGLRAIASSTSAR